MTAYLFLLIKLFGWFFAVGTVSFGGGYAMIPLFQRIMESTGWVSPDLFLDLIALAQMTPGPVAVNTATFAGFRTAGIPGAALATAGVLLPSFLLVIFLSRRFFQNRTHPLMRHLLYGVKPAAAGLIGSAALWAARHAWFPGPAADAAEAAGAAGVSGAFFWPAPLLTAAGFLFLFQKRLHPLWLIVVSAIAGILLF